MNLRELKDQLVHKKVAPILVFTGPEIAIMDIYIDKICKAAGSSLVKATNVASIFSRLQNASLLGKPNVYVIRDDKDYLKQEKVWDVMKSGEALGDNRIILVYTNLDKRGKFYKAHTKVLVEFEKLGTSMLAKYILKDIDIGQQNAEKLAEMCNNDYSRILLECDKLKHLTTALGIPPVAAFKYAIENKVIHYNPNTIIFDITDAICRRDEQATYQFIKEFQNNLESPLPIISILYNNIRDMLVVRGAGKGPDISKRTGLSGFQIKLAKEKGNAYSIGELARALKVIRNTEKGIKTGRIDASIALDYILIHIL